MQGFPVFLASGKLVQFSYNPFYQTFAKCNSLASTSPRVLHCKLPAVLGSAFTTCALLSPYSYSIMLRCWAADPEERPTFAELRFTFDIMMSNQRTESYVDLIVDDPLPYYHMKPAEDEDEEMDSPTLSLPQSSA